MSKLDGWSSPANKLLASLPVKEYERLLPSLETVTLENKEVLHEAGAPIEHVYFPADAIVALLSSAEKDASVEVGMIGSEGMVGAPILLGSRTTPTQALVISEGSAVRLEADALKKEFKRSGTMQDLLLPYAHALLSESAQTAACHSFHTPQERLCRFLLMMHDRVRAEDFRLTQDFISQMLGTRRATVTEAAHALQKKGLIDYSRGRICVRDRRGLEALACQCYGVIQEQFSQIVYA